MRASPRIQPEFRTLATQKGPAEAEPFLDECRAYRFFRLKFAVTEPSSIVVTVFDFCA